MDEPPVQRRPGVAVWGPRVASRRHRAQGRLQYMVYHLTSLMWGSQCYMLVCTHITSTLCP